MRSAPRARLTRGPLPPTQEPIGDEHGGSTHKVVFIVLYRAVSLTAKLQRLCDAFNASQHGVCVCACVRVCVCARVRCVGGGVGDAAGGTQGCPTLTALVRSRTRARPCSARPRTTGTRALRAPSAAAHDHRPPPPRSAELEENRKMLLRVLENAAGQYYNWLAGVRAEKSVYFTLNHFEADVQGMLRAQAWCLKVAVGDVRAALASTRERFVLDDVAQPWPTPPTYFKTNKYTKVVQALVDT